ncbi:heparinase II/III family protein [Microlunatus sp. GCM10028923]|uniref:heparinase II/III domain-containing protein n=1 Tax=Microlunatus sp. GCM10028923 TaxID=3273400 RepID=UPI003616A5B4
MIMSGPPEERGGWWHDYVCGVHGVELEPGDLLGTFPAAGVSCRHGCRLDTERIRAAWLVLSHQAWARRARRLAGHTDPADRAEALRLLTAYAGIYARLAVADHDQAQGWMLRGRLFHQALTDAVWGVNIGHAAWSLATAGDRAELRPLLPLLDDLAGAALRARGVLVAENRFDSNYVAWLNAAGLASARAAAQIRGDAWADRDGWLTGDHGQFAHLAASTGEDGWEWEGSTYYHGFVLRAYLLSLRGSDPAGWPAVAAERLGGMITALARLAMPGGTLPAVHDGPYLREALGLEWQELGVLARGAFAGDPLRAVTDHAKAESGRLADDLADGLAGWFAGPPLPYRDEPAVITVAERVGLAVLKGAGIHAVLDYGPPGGSHGHHDKLALYLYGSEDPWQPDYGQVPYGNRAWRDRYAAAAAHPTIRIDDREPGEAAGRLIERTDRSLTVAIDDPAWYPGVSATRRVTLDDDHLIDLVTVRCAEEHRIRLGLRAGVDVSVVDHGPYVRTEWSGRESLSGWHLGAPLIAYPGFGPADDPARQRTWLDFETTGREAVFCSVYQTGAASRRIAGVALSAGEVVIDFEEGFR